ncbi:hypothetical protein M1L60_12865 [Actinoplanes sp. TRM 88003]|uniref:Uncharacterized protein n=1 Tax=Paractinoplanes aksuensis TaxID=2939490 RepID=A0ABT1DKW0_9ACTN|nr:hypothetical protein [Actinoplanes aksuensis]MCO8271486.1 hypothetical protein [Actinoplanes aksuensis]
MTFPTPGPTPGGFRPGPTPGGFRPGPPPVPRPPMQAPSPAPAPQSAVDEVTGEIVRETGHPAVDAVLSALENASRLAPSEQIAEYEAAHQVLQETLASIDR